MTTINSYYFNNLTNITSDSIDRSQKNVYNTRFSNYTLANYYSENTSDSHVHFATQQPTMMFSGTAKGFGLGPNSVDVDSTLLIKTEQERSLEKLVLVERPFATVPYLGRGSCDPSIESQLMQGEPIHDKKSVSTIMDKSFAPYTMYPLDNNMKEHVSNYAVANDWNLPTRILSEDPYLKKANRPNMSV
jgi:hypothetical protein